MCIQTNALTDTHKENTFTNIWVHLFVDVHLRLRIYGSTHLEMDIGAAKNKCGILKHDRIAYALARTNWHQYDMLLSEQQKHVTRNEKQQNYVITLPDA